MPNTPPPSPLPQGARPWTKPVTPDMSAWATSIVADPASYPMGATVMKQFGAFTALARVEHHTWTIRDGKRVSGSFRGVTLYEVPAPSSGSPSPDGVGGAVALALILFL